MENVFALNVKRSEPPAVEERFPFSDQTPSTASAIAQPSSEEAIAIQAVDLSKNFGAFHAVRKVNISIKYGEVYGLLGANGAGKTTTIKMLCGLVEPSAGQMVLAGKASDLRNQALRLGIGYMSQKFTLYEDLTVMENLRFYGGVYQVEPDLLNERVTWVLKTCQLLGSENMLTRLLPGGFKQRLAFGATILHQPQILFLDEPTSGVDPLARRQLWSLISEFARQGTAILVTTHFLEEAEHCHQLGFMAAGEIVASGTPYQIKKSQLGKLLEVRTSNNQSALDVLHRILPHWQSTMFGDSLHVVAEGHAQETLVPECIKQAGLTVTSLRTIPFSLEDSFIGIVERNRLAAIEAA